MVEENQDQLRDRDQGLRRNCLDSMKHALAHFSQLTYESERFHDRKWAILSVAHAAEVFCNLLLTALDPRHPRGGRYPTLPVAIEQLQEHSSFDGLSLGERRVIREVFPLLPRLRNLLMHRPAPDRLEIGDATVALLALLYIARRRLKVSASDLFDQHPPIEADVLDELRALEQERWFVVAEQLLLEDYGHQHLGYCNHCGRFALTPDLGCQACFAQGSP